MQLEDLGEFALIDRITRLTRRLDGAARRSSVSLGIGDDAAVLRLRRGEEVVVTTDAFVEDVHFRWRTASAAVVGRRAVAASLSDLAAMGARPLGCTLALAAPGTLALRRFDALLRGVVAECERHAAPLVGGNLARARESSLTLTALGAVARGRALTRSGTRPGDRVLVTGGLGRSALERARAEHGGAAIRRVPEPRLAAGRALARIPAVVACIDVSDGLEADLGHLLGERLDAPLAPDALPCAPGFRAACRRLGLDPAEALLRGGEDYELLFTVRGERPSAAALGRRLGVAVTEIGRVRARPRGGPGRPARAGGGWRHF